MLVKRSTWWATAVGTAVGTGGWMFGIGRIFSHNHPGWALFWITVAATFITQIVVELEVRRHIVRVQNTQASRSPQPPRL